MLIANRLGIALIKVNPECRLRSYDLDVVITAESCVVLSGKVRKRRHTSLSDSIEGVRVCGVFFESNRIALCNLNG